MNFSSLPVLSAQRVNKPAEIYVEPSHITDFLSFTAYLFELDLPQCHIPPHNFEYPLGSGATFHVSKYVVPHNLIPLRVVGVDGYPVSSREAPEQYLPGGSFVALKRIQFSSLHSEEESLDQAALVARRLKTACLEIRCLTHPPIRDNKNIIGLLAIAWEERDGLWPILISEFADLGTLASYQIAKGLAPLEMTSFLLDVACGLHALHSCNIIHGDIKSENVLIVRVSESEVRAKLADFSCALMDVQGESIQVGGTELWMAPECTRSVQRDLLAQTDIYSFGLMVWRVAIFQGKNPFKLFNIPDLQTWQRLKEDNKMLALALQSIKATGFGPDNCLRLQDILLLTLQAKPTYRASDITTIIRLLCYGKGSAEILDNLSSHK